MPHIRTNDREFAEGAPRPMKSIFRKIVNTNQNAERYPDPMNGAYIRFAAHLSGSRRLLGGTTKTDPITYRGAVNSERHTIDDPSTTCGNGTPIKDHAL
jgi:hypothetical protein